jgi:hypothetical protein
MTGALVLTHACLAVTLLSPHVLAPRLLDKGRGAGRDASGLASRRGGHTSRLARRLIRGLTSRLSSGSRGDSDVGGTGERRSDMRPILLMSDIRCVNHRLEIGIIAVKHVDNVIGGIVQVNRSRELNRSNTKDSNGQHRHSQRVTRQESGADVVGRGGIGFLPNSNVSSRSGSKSLEVIGQRDGRSS